MEIQFILNKKQVSVEVGPDAVLLDVLRDLGCKSVKCGCETTNCGLCTVWIDVFPALFWRQAPQGTKLPRWKALRRKRQDSANFWRRKGRNSVAFVRRDLS